MNIYWPIVLLCLPSLVLAQGVFVQKLPIKKPTTLDWKYATSIDFLKLPSDSESKSKYQVRKQTYDFFGPRKKPKGELALILFISPGNVPLEWKQFEPVCRSRQILFAGARNVGNAQDPDVRVRAATEVLGDVRRRYRVDPNRTYIAGFSGGAIVATRLAFALPESCGGLLCIGQRLFLPTEAALLDRASERLSVAAICGSNELIGPEVEHIEQHFFAANEFRCRAFISRGSGHRMPKPELITTAVQWLEHGLKSRVKRSETFPATRLNPNKAYDEKQWSLDLVEEAERRWTNDQKLAAITLLEWIVQRWPKTDAALRANNKLNVFKPFVADGAEIKKAQSAREKKSALAIANGYDKLANDRRAWFTRERRANYAKEAIRRFESLADSDSNYAQRIEELSRIAD